MRIISCLIIMFLLSCSNIDRSNPLDENGDNYHVPVIVQPQSECIPIYDTFPLSVYARDKGPIEKYVWNINGKYTDTTDECYINVAFSDTGLHQIFVKAIDDEGLESQPVRYDVCVGWKRPVVTAMVDTSVSLKDSLTITALSIEHRHFIKKFIWARNGSTFSDTTTGNSLAFESLKVAFSDSGRHVVLVKVIDDRRVISNPDTCIVNVTLDPPVVVVTDSVSVNPNDSLTITTVAFDNGKVEKYIWAPDGGTYSDTTVQGSLKIAYKDSGRHVVLVRAVDDDDVKSQPDSCIVTVAP